MPPTVQHNLISVRGITGPAGTTAETWQYGLRMKLATPAAFFTSADKTAIVAALLTFHTSPSTKISGRMLLTEVRFSQVGTNGLQIGDTEVTTVTPTPGGGGNSPLLPPQCSVVVSLLSSSQRGKGVRGRIFLPSPSVSLEADFTMTSSDQADISGAAVQLLNAINARKGTGDGVVIIGHTGTGTSRAVTRVRVGQVVDTHRSRRRQLPELYVEQAIS